MKKILKSIFWPFIYLGMKIIFPKVKNKDYYTFRIVTLGIRQRLFGLNKAVPWPVHNSSVVISSEKIILKSDKAPGISIGCFIDGRNGIEIGKNVLIGPRASIISQVHDLNNYPNYISAKPIKIGRNCLISTNSIILPEVELGEHTVVAAYAVVNKSFPEGNQVLAGNPARVIKKLDSYKEE